MNAPETCDPALESDILGGVEHLQRDMVELATTLVRFPSLNGDEAGAQDFMEGLFRGMGLATERFEVRDADWFASSATTDARAFNLYGSIPATCYGPDARNIHGIDESVSIESTLRVAQVLALFMARWCGVEKSR